VLLFLAISIYYLFYFPVYEFALNKLIKLYLVTIINFIFLIYIIKIIFEYMIFQYLLQTIIHIYILI